MMAGVATATADGAADVLLLVDNAVVVHGIDRIAAYRDRHTEGWPSTYSLARQGGLGFRYLHARATISVNSLENETVQRISSTQRLNSTREIFF